MRLNNGSKLLQNDNKVNEQGKHVPGPGQAWHVIIPIKETPSISSLLSFYRLRTNVNAL